MSLGQSHLLAAVLAALVGLVVGSFGALVADRVPRGESIVRPASHCDSCGAPLRSTDNVPVVAYILLKGRCRHCSARIPSRTLLVELATAALFALVAWRLPTLWALPSYLVVVAGLVILSAIDFEHKRLPAAIVYLTALVAAPLLVLASGMTGKWNALLVGLVAAAACFAVFFAVFIAVPKGMGFGDVRLAGLCGGWLGWLGASVVPVGIVVSFVLAGVPAMVLLARGKATRKSAIAFGPFLAGGTVFAICFGRLVAHAWAHV